jgi:hypothetical protein
MKYTLVLLAFLLLGCSDKAALVRERMEKISAKTEHNDEISSSTYLIMPENYDEAEKILNDVFGDANLSDTVKYENIPVVIEHVYKHVDMSAYSMQLGIRQKIVMVMRTKDLDNALSRYRQEYKQRDTASTPFAPKTPWGGQ